MDNRNTITAICPHCGARQEADPTQDAAICRYCGAPFAVQTAVGAYSDRNIGPQASAPNYGGGVSPGPTYYSEPQKPKKRRIFWWIMGWIFCFPIPLTILIARNKKLNGWVKAGIIAAGWIAYLLLGARYRAGTPERTSTTAERSPSIVETTSTPRPTARPTPKPTAKPTPTPKPAEEEPAGEEPEAEESAEEEPSFSAGVTPEFKAAMDSYEAFFDEYCEFMKTMSDDPTDFNYLLQYADMMARYADTMEKLDAVDETELSPADDAYYIEVMARIEVKLLEAANYMS